MPPFLHRVLRVQPATRYPADPRAVFVLTFAIIVGLPLLIAHVAPGSIQELMPIWGVIAWGWSLTLGCVATLVGMARQTPTGIIIEQVGSVTVGFATIIYGVCVLAVAGLSGAVAGTIIIAFGCSSLYRWLQLQALLAQGQRTVDIERERRSR